MDLAITNTRIFTGDAGRPWAEALWIRDDRIVKVGGNAEVRAACTRTTEVIELPGRLITPGLVDAHTHFLHFGLTAQMVDLRGLSSLSACRARIDRPRPPGRRGNGSSGRVGTIMIGRKAGSRPGTTWMT